MGFPYIPTGFPAEVPDRLQLFRSGSPAPTPEPEAHGRPREIEVPRFSGDSESKIPATPSRAESVVRVGHLAFARTIRVVTQPIPGKGDASRESKRRDQFVRVRLPRDRVLPAGLSRIEPRVGLGARQTPRPGSLPDSLRESAATNQADRIHLQACRKDGDPPSDHSDIAVVQGTA